jgi:hypothetical protein
MRGQGLMRLALAIGALMALSCGAYAQVASTSYWLLLKDNGHTWCGYADTAEFRSDVKNLKPLESARVTFSSDKLMEVTYQLSAESGDWVVVDKYTPSNDRLVLRRANLLQQPPGFEIIEETSIHGGKVEPFHVVSTTTLDGKTVDASNADIPAVSVVTNLSEAPFVAVVTEMRRRSVSKLCKTF